MLITGSHQHFSPCHPKCWGQRLACGRCMVNCHSFPSCALVPAFGCSSVLAPWQYPSFSLAFDSHLSVFLVIYILVPTCCLLCLLRWSWHLQTSWENTLCFRFPAFQIQYVSASLVSSPNLNSFSHWYWNLMQLSNTSQWYLHQDSADFLHNNWP